MAKASHTHELKKNLQALHTRDEDWSCHAWYYSIDAQIVLIYWLRHPNGTS
jgi:hypothetical protein